MKYLSNEPQPGIVACILTDCHDKNWFFVEKTASVSSNYIDEKTKFPMDGYIGGEIIGRKMDHNSRDILIIDTSLPYDIETVDGNSRFEIVKENVLMTMPNQ